ncbi:organic cation transporter protein-like [Physella acuta]|uniref:organic cation transporter protein-like n=1 Tax=Physella acuta TaxID=109671 RepID=UPI0027DC6FE0|nr:organic cation transporter protein-like [Physella acuta]
MTRIRNLELDDALEQVGMLGRFQLLMFLLLFPAAMVHGARMTSGAFFMLETRYRCALPGWVNDTFDVRATDHQIAVNRSIPADDQCHVYSLNKSFEYDEYNRPINGSHYIQPCTNGWVYDKSLIRMNALTQLDLVCDRRIYRSHGSMLIYVGSLVGSTLLGLVSDRFGRKLCFLLSVLILLASGLALPWSNVFYVLGILQFLVGGASTGMFASAFVMSLELVTSKHRKIPGLTIQVFFTSGEVIMAAAFYGLRDWRWVNVVITAPAAVFLLYYWLVPESLRWLITMKKYDQVSKVLARIAATNGVHLDVDYESSTSDLLQSYETEGEGHTQRVTSHDTFLDLFKSRVLCLRSFIICFNWLVVNFVFYVFVLNSAHLRAGNVFITFIIGACVEVPAHLVSLLLVDKVGRKPVHLGYLMLAALTSGAAVGVSVKVVKVKSELTVTVLAMVGKFGAAGLMGTSFLWMTELWPTSVRSTGLGIGSSCARAGAIVAPYVVGMTTNLGGALPFVTVCGATFLAFILDLALPETNRRALPDTIAEALNFARCPDVSVLKTTHPTNYGSTEETTPWEDDCLLFPKQRDNTRPPRSTTIQDAVIY